jgi:multisubunit Na+/H+ antiporter MnhE subunit
MTQAVLRVGGLTAIYLLVLTSVDLGDLLVGGLLALGVAFALRPRGPGGASGRAPRPHLRAAVAVAAGTTAELVRGTWRTIRFCLGDRGRQGFVEIPRAGRSQRNVAFWGLLTGEAPDEVPVDVDTERDVLIVHLIDASDPQAVRERHDRTSSAQRKVVH